MPLPDGVRGVACRLETLRNSDLLDRETSNPTDLHDLQDIAYRESLAADMVKSREIYIPVFDKCHPALTEPFDEMVHLLEDEYQHFSEEVWVQWGFRRVQS